MKRNPHPARRSRIATLGISSTAFVSIITSLAWNTHQAELVANVTDTNAVPVETTAPAATTPAPAAISVTPAATIAPTAPAAPAKPTKTSAPAAPAAPAPTVAPATPVTPAAPTTAAPAPAAPAPTVVYTCMSPGGKTENPTASGKCKNAQYGYVLTQI
ncbi:MAG: hypothetical protein NT097_00660 [Actinobacteria bacterium]|nr:hypothetical protein [Actinomycetota bacterium]